MKTVVQPRDIAKRKIEQIRANAKAAAEQLSCHYRGQQTLLHLKKFLYSPDGVMGLDDWTPVITIIQAYQKGIREGVL